MLSPDSPGEDDEDEDEDVRAERRLEIYEVERTNGFIDSDDQVEGLLAEAVGRPLEPLSELHEDFAEVFEAHEALATGFATGGDREVTLLG